MLTTLTPRTALIHGILAMAVIVTASNILVQYPFGDYLTYGAFTYPAAFLVTDLMNRLHGPAAARRVAVAGFVVAVILSIWLATPRIAVASGSAFLAAQLLDIGIFSALRKARWWKAPLISSIVGAGVDTLIFFTLAFAAPFVMLGPNDSFAIEPTALFGMTSGELPRWIGWALGDYAVKLTMALLMLAPYALFTRAPSPAT